jgi:hypothetical protein
MADNVSIPTAGTAAAIAADDISSVLYQRVKLSLGADGTAVDAVAGSGVVGTGVQRVVLATDVALPAGTNLLGSASAKLGTDAIMDGVTPLTPKFAAIAASSSGDNTLIAAVVSKKIRVLSYTLVAAGAVVCRFEDGAGGTAKSGQMALAANGVLSVPFSPVGHFETTANTLLNLELGGAVSVAGHICYVEV